jgi:hypothetical protein
MAIPLASISGVLVVETVIIPMVIARGLICSGFIVINVLFIDC